MMDVRKACNEWKDKTFSEMLNEISNIDQQLMNTVKECFDVLRISSAKVTGYCCEGLPKTEEGHTGVRKSYSLIFHELCEDGDFSPVRYLIKLVEEFNQTKYTGNTAKLIGFMSRGLRTLTSLLREPDFAYKLKNILVEYDNDIEVSINSKQDTADHTDVLLNFRNNEYRIWLFQFSSRGLPHDIERLTEQRGDLPEGTHVLCPLRTEYANEYERYKKQLDSIQKKIKNKNNELADCSVRAIKKRADLQNKLEELQQQLPDINKRFLEASQKCSKHMDIVSGWYLYSEYNVQSIADYIINCKEVQPYIEVKDMLLAPQRYLEEVRIFKK